MNTPVTFDVGPLTVTAHVVFEMLSYAVGFAVFRMQRRRSGDHLEVIPRLGVVAAAIVGAAVGSWLLGWLADPDGLREALAQPRLLMGRKTIVGGLLGGLLAVEWFKRRHGISRRTGDLFALPLAIGMVIGRLGCLSAGLTDGTHGLATDLPWGIAFEDGVARHPVRLLEIAFLVVVAVVLVRRRPRIEGGSFALFMGAYMLFRLAVDFLKPGYRLIGLTPIQWAALLGAAYYVLIWPRRARCELAGEAG